MPTVISVENLSKRYLIGHQRQEGYANFRDALAEGARDLGRKIFHPFLSSTGQQVNNSTIEEFYALRDVSFEIKRGERVGIIGRNGAGKSTLLKLLSRITEPTSGRITIDGRVASLLEVGTGFHPELTGRENIFLNGAVLGMTKVEIKRKFDEIVAFSEVEKFLDTPVKRYSSGMYVRLAFAVAAHLEPEILIVDEVLAVGDAQFQKKCLGKMKEVGQEGRTMLFVSHNMGAVRNLCSRAIMLDRGRLVANAGVDAVIGQYLSFSQGASKVGEISWSENDAPSCEEIILQGIRILGNERQVFSIYDATRPIEVEIRFQVKRPVLGLRTVLVLSTTDGVVAFATTNHSIMGEHELPPGNYTTSCKIPANLLNNVGYAVKVSFGIPGFKELVHTEEHLTFMAEGSGGHGSSYSEKWPGVVAPKLNWELVENHADQTTKKI